MSPEQYLQLQATLEDGLTSQGNEPLEAGAGTGEQYLHRHSGTRVGAV